MSGRNRTAGVAAAPTPSAAALGNDTLQGPFYRPATSPTALEQEPATPLEMQIADFWGRRKVLEDVHYHLARPPVELALLRRLGAPAPGAEGPDALAQLQIVYRRVTDRVWALAFAPDEEEAAAEATGRSEYDSHC